MIIEISIGVAALVFSITCYFLIMTLLILQKMLVRAEKTLAETECMLNGMQKRFTSLDPVLHSLANVGEILENKTYALKQNYIIKHAELKEESIHKDETSREIIEWALLSAQLFQKYKKRR